MDSSPVLKGECFVFDFPSESNKESCFDQYFLNSQSNRKIVTKNNRNFSKGNKLHTSSDRVSSSLTGSSGLNFAIRNETPYVNSKPKKAYSAVRPMSVKPRIRRKKSETINNLKSIVYSNALRRSWRCLLLKASSKQEIKRILQEKEKELKIVLKSKTTRSLTPMQLETREKHRIYNRGKELRTYRILATHHQEAKNRLKQSKFLCEQSQKHLQYKKYTETKKKIHRETQLSRQRIKQEQKKLDLKEQTLVFDNVKSYLNDKIRLAKDKLTEKLERQKVLSHEQRRTIASAERLRIKLIKDNKQY